tara:strand:+ start:834 stop:977 length:144 start_codon:yes stop_codon:yes gene_type:complete
MKFSAEHVVTGFKLVKIEIEKSWNTKVFEIIPFLGKRLDFYTLLAIV